MKFNGVKIITDTQGYLINPKEWSEELAEEIARLENIILTEEHWKVIYFVRSFYLKYNISPTIRMLIQALRQIYTEDQIDSRYLFRLFNKGPAKLATKIAGLPKPVKCL